MKIEEVNMPIVGETYDVPFVGPNPIIGTPHIDKAYFLSTPCQYHVDTRFWDLVPISEVVDHKEIIRKEWRIK